MNYLNRLFEPVKPAPPKAPKEPKAPEEPEAQKNLAREDFEAPKPPRPRKPVPMSPRSSVKMTPQRAKIERQLKSQTMHVRLPSDLHDALLAKAMEYDVSISQLVRLVLQKAAEPSTKLRLGVDFKG